MTKLEKITEDTYNRALDTIDKSLYELLEYDITSIDDSFYIDYKEAFNDIVEKLKEHINPANKKQ